VVMPTWLRHYPLLSTYKNLHVSVVYKARGHLPPEKAKIGKYVKLYLFKLHLSYRVQTLYRVQSTDSVQSTVSVLCMIDVQTVQSTETVLCMIDVA